MVPYRGNPKDKPLLLFPALKLNIWLSPQLARKQYGYAAYMGTYEGLTRKIQNHKRSSWTTVPSHLPRTKHIDIRHHFIREAVDNKLIELHRVETSADIFTKALSVELHQRHMEGLGLKLNFSYSLFFLITIQGV